MPKDYNNNIESFSIDYRETGARVIHKRSTKTVTGQSMAIKKSKPTEKKTSSIFATLSIICKSYRNPKTRI